MVVFRCDATIVATIVCLLFVCRIIVGQPSYTWDDWTILDEYVQSDDGYYSWTQLTQYEYNGVTIHIINMTSQKWQDESFASKSVWWHFMGIAIPHDLSYSDAAFLYIDGGNNGNDGDAELPPYDFPSNIGIAKMANETGCCGAYILQVPNQPIVFSNDPNQESRHEDDIIAWTWRTYIDSPTPDQTVILRLPMTKAAKRGLDTIHEVVKEKLPSTHIDKFFITGKSKRGWTTWSTACSDRRVIGMLPMVFSLLNIPATVNNHFQNMNGAYSFALESYWKLNLTAELYSPQTDGVWEVEDMYRYRARLEGIPKVEILSSGDQFFLLDDSLQWWNDMPGPKWMMMLPNAEHSMVPHQGQTVDTATAFMTSILQNLPLPDVSWTMQETELGGLIVIDTRPQPVNITAFVATTLVNDTRRDFRLMELNENGDLRLHRVSWKEDINVVDFGNGYQYGAAAEKVEGEWVGFFIQGTWEGPPPSYRPLTFTTQVNVIPYTRPRGPCLTNDECYGYLV